MIEPTEPARFHEAARIAQYRIEQAANVRADRGDSGMTVFRNISEAIRAGFSLYDKTADGYTVRRMMPNGQYAMALVRFE